MSNTTYSLEEAAEIAEIKPARLKLWVDSEQFTPSVHMKFQQLSGDSTVYRFTQKDIRNLVEFAANQHGTSANKQKSRSFTDDGKQENFTVAQVAALWELSPDTIQRLFQDEPGVVTLGQKNPRGKRRRVTLRIPRSILERVKKRRSNP